MGCFQTGLTGKSADGTAPADPVTRSLRFDGTAHLERATGSTSTTWTLAFWVKRSTLSGPAQAQYLATWAISGSAGEGLSFRGTADSSNLDEISLYDGSGHNRSVGVFRDPAAWGHFTISVNAGTATVYYNGEAVISNASGIQAWGSMRLGAWLNENDLEGYMADVYGIEGSALDHTSFTEANESGGGLKPKEYTGLFGLNGFHIDAQPTNSADLLVSSVGRREASTTFADSASGLTFTAGGNSPSHRIGAVNPFTGPDRAIFFDGSNDYFKVASASSDFAFGTSDYTIEGWFNFAHLTGVQTICDLRPSNSVDSTRCFFGTTGSGLYVYFNGGNTTLAASGSLAQDYWHHIAFVRESSTLKTYVDGKLKTSVSASDNHSTDGTPHFGSTNPSPNHEGILAAYSYGHRIINGTAAYTGEFTPPSGKLTATGGTYPSTNNVNTSITSGHTKLLIQPDKDDSSIGDETSNHTITTSGALIAGSSPYEPDAKSSAIYFDGSQDQIKTSQSSNLTFGTGSFTVELWFWPDTTSLNADRGIIADEVYGYTGGWGLLQKNGDLAFWTKNTSGTNWSLIASSALTAGQWQHIAVSYDSSNTTTRLFVDGSVVATGTTSGWNMTGDQIKLGFVHVYHPAAGYQYDVRATKGSALYTANFDVPTAPFELNPVYLGGDQSGNKNHFQPEGISQAHDVMLDTPTKNYATWNPLDLQETASTAPTFTEGNLSLSTNSSGYGRIHSTISLPSTSKWYAEFYSTSFDTIGVRRKVGGGWPSGSSVLATVSSGGSITNASGTSQSGLASWSSGDILGVEVDCDANTIQFLRNGSNYGTSESFTHYADETFFTYTDGSSGTAYNAIANFGQDPTFAGNYTGTLESSEWAHSPSTGFKSLNTSNLAAPTVTPEENFATKRYTGAGGSEEINLGFTPALTWIKRWQDSGYWHGLYDSVRGLSAGALASNSTNTEDSTQRVASFDSDSGSEGFTLSSSHYSYTNTSGKGFVSWNWKAHQGGPATRSHTLTLEVNDLYGTAYDWYSTKLEVWEGSTKLKDIEQPVYNSGGSTTYTIKTNDTDKIKLVWDVDSSMDWYAMYAVLKDSSNSTLASWDGNNWDGSSSTPADGSNFYLPSGHDSSNAAETGVVESPTDTIEAYNSAAGFTMIKYSGEGSSDGDTKTLNHSLGVPLELVIVKARTSIDGYDNGDWLVWHKDLTSGNFLRLNATSGEDSESYGNNLIATNNSGSQHQVVVSNGYSYDSGNGHYLNSGPDNGSGENYILYGWAGVEGHSKFGSYQGNTSSDGPFIYTGFRPSLVIIKKYSTSGSSKNWWVIDSTRNGHNPIKQYLYTNSSGAEGTSTSNWIDFTSNGFKLRGSGSTTNQSGWSYVYLAFAEQSFAASSNAVA